MIRNKNNDEYMHSGIDGIRVVNEHIYFYTDITPETAVNLNSILQDVSLKLAPTAFTSMHEVGHPSPIWLHINSGGGEVFSSFSIADTVARISQVIPIVTIVEGCAASGATIISTAGTKRFIRKNAFMLVHELRNVHWGKYTELKESMTNSTEIMKTIKQWYKDHTKIPDAEMDSILSKDFWWNSKKCLKYGLVDGII